MREDGGFFEHDERKTFAFRSVRGILVVWGKEDVLYGVGNVQEGA